MFLFGPPKVEKMMARRDVKGLVKALGYMKDERVREFAALALGRIGDSRAVAPLCVALQDTGWSVSKAAAEALGQIKDPRAVEPLIAAFRAWSGNVCETAICALGEIGDARAVEPLVAALDDERYYVRRAAAKALGAIGDARAVEPLITAFQDVWTLENAIVALIKIGTPAVKSLIVTLEDEDRDVREAAARALGAIGDARAVEPLTAALKDEDENVREVAAKALEQISLSLDSGDFGS